MRNVTWTRANIVLVASHCLLIFILHFKYFNFMRKLFLTILCYMSIIACFAQSQPRLPFQGRLTNSQGIALTGTYTFDFQIVGTTYSETFSSVAVNNGLYSVVLGTNNPLPTNLFQSANSAQLQVSINGNILQTVAIHAPIENDPSVPANIKDGIDWQEISNKPLIDTQKLSLNGTILGIGGGNSVTLPQNNTPNDITVGTAGTVANIGSSNPPTNVLQQSVPSVWQSFKVNQSGQLNEIKVYLSNLNTTDIRLKIYSNVGNTTQAIYDYLYSSSILGASYGIKTFSINNTTQAINLLSNTNYTFELIAECGSCSQSFLIGYNNNNSYVDGQANISTTSDLFFEIGVGISQGPTMSVNNQNNGFVGIGTANTLGYKVRIMGANANQLLLDNQGQPNTMLSFGNDGQIKANISWNNINNAWNFNATNTASFSFSSNITELLKLNSNGNIKATNGRIEDKTGLVMPVGTIVAFGGTTAPAGWLLCDGASLSVSLHPELYAAIANNFGGIVNSTFNLPDMRGRFLRGVDGGAGLDIDKNYRTAMVVGGNTGNNVGSVQDDAIQNHVHVIPSPAPGDYGLIQRTTSSSNNKTTGSSDNGGRGTEPNVVDAPGGGWTGGCWDCLSETRPNNINVNYIIKY